MCKKRFLTVAFFLLLPIYCLAQIDSSYIGFFQYKASVRTYLQEKFIFLNQTAGSGGEGIAYQPNTPPSVGVGFSINNTIVDLSYGYGIDFLRDKSKGKTRAFDMQLQYYGRRLVADLFVQRYEGFYANDAKTGNVHLFPDLKIAQYSGYVQYVFNNKRFSYKAAFVQNQRQLKSAGSWLVGGGIYITKINSDTSFVFRGEHSFSNFQFGIGGGYAYTWVLSPRWFVNASGTVNLNFGSETIWRFGRQRLEVYPSAFPRLSVGYNKERWSLGLTYVNNLTFPSLVYDSNFILRAGSWRLTYIFRLQSVTLPTGQRIL